MAAPSPAAGSDLCRECGLCCTGVLYARVRAEESEVPHMRTHGFDVRKEGTRSYLQLPCGHHRGGGCGIYDDRYSRCRSYRCALLGRLEAGEIGPGPARQIVEQAKSALRSLAALDPAAALVANRMKRREAGPPAAGAGATAARSWLESVAFDLFLDRFFRNKPLVRREGGVHRRPGPTAGAADGE